MQLMSMKQDFAQKNTPTGKKAEFKIPHDSRFLNKKVTLLTHTHEVKIRLLANKSYLYIEFRINLL